MVTKASCIVATLLIFFYIYQYNKQPSKDIENQATNLTLNQPHKVQTTSSNAESKSEFKDVTWNGSPKSYQISDRKPIWNIIHCTDDEETPGKALDCSNYDKIRSDGASAHFYYDPDNTIQEVMTGNIAFCSLKTGNNYGIQHELCGKASQTKSQWLDVDSKKIIERAAKICAEISLKYDIPIRWLNSQQIKNFEKGLVTHYDITINFEGTHTDPGANFPKDYFLERVKYYKEELLEK